MTESMALAPAPTRSTAPTGVLHTIQRQQPSQRPTDPILLLPCWLTPAMLRERNPCCILHRLKVLAAGGGGLQGLRDPLPAHTVPATAAGHVIRAARSMSLTI